MGVARGGLILIRETFDRLPPSEKKLASYILSKPIEVVTMTVSQLGSESGTSGAAVSRLCKSLNVKSFQELKLRINGDLIQDTEVKERDIKPGELVEDIVQKVTNQATHMLIETAQLLDKKQLEKAANAIVKANNIHLIGIGASSISAIDAQQKFLRIRKNATFSLDLHMSATVIANAEPTDVVMGISFSGESQEILKLLQLANQCGATTISLTKYGQTAISEEAAINLYTSPMREATFRSAATSTRLAQLHVIDLLFMSVVSKQFDNTVQYLDATREAVDYIRKK